MARFVFKRLIYALFTIWSICTITFFIAASAPGDPVLLAAGQHTDPATIAMIRHNLGLDLPLHIRYLHYLFGIIHGDLGSSLVTHEPIVDFLRRGIPPTFILATTAITIALVIGVVLGVSASLRPNSWVDRTLMASLLVGVSVPNFVLGPVFILIFAVRLGWLPVAGWGEPIYLVLPAIVLAARPAALIGRMTRSSMLEVLRQDYIRTAWAKGLEPWQVIFKHALKNAFLPVLTTTGVSFGYLLSGSFVVETVFGVPGVGFASINSLTTNDYSMIQGTTLLLAIAFVSVNLIVDILYAFIDPRVKLEAK
jgi:ABC-type dipeptide/oligopeptide/nickel transport system permease component